MSDETDAAEACPSCGAPLGEDGCTVDIRTIKTDVGRVIGTFELGWCREVGEWDRRLS